jgi:hypothetical protein
MSHGQFLPFCVSVGGPVTTRVRPQQLSTACHYGGEAFNGNSDAQQPWPLMPSGRGNSAIGPPKAADLMQRVSLLWAAQGLVVKAGECIFTDRNAVGGPPPARGWVRLKTTPELAGCRAAHREGAHDLGLTLDPSLVEVRLTQRETRQLAPQR